MIAIIDFGSGNLRSVQKAFEKVGVDAVVTQSPNVIKKARKIVLPGVGAMQPAMKKLSALKLIHPIKDAVMSGKPFLGICLGLQLLFDVSEEGGAIKGLGLVKGRVLRFKKLKVPHMGWNQIHIKDSACALYKGIDNPSFAYFCHSYFVEPQDKSLIATTTDYGVVFASSIHKDNLFGVQFHPEKSQDIGLKILKNFVEMSL